MTVCLLSAPYLQGQHRIAGGPQTASREPLKSALLWLGARLHSDPDRLHTSQSELPFLFGTREERSCSRRVVAVSSLPLHGGAYAWARTMVGAASLPGSSIARSFAGSQKQEQIRRPRRHVTPSRDRRLFAITAPPVMELTDEGTDEHRLH